MGLIYAGLIPLPSFSPFWLDKMHTGEKKKSMSQQVKVVNVGGAANIQLSMHLILFVHQLPLGPSNSAGFMVAERPCAV